MRGDTLRQNNAAAILLGERCPSLALAFAVHGGARLHVTCSSHRPTCSASQVYETRVQSVKRICLALLDALTLYVQWSAVHV